MIRCLFDRPAEERIADWVCQKRIARMIAEVEHHELQCRKIWKGPFANHHKDAALNIGFCLEGLWRELKGWA